VIEAFPPGFASGLLPVEGVEAFFGDRVLRSENLSHRSTVFKCPPDGLILVESPGQFLCIGGLHKNPLAYYTTAASKASSSGSPDALLV